MRFNEKELASLSRQPSEMAAELGMRGPKKGDGNAVYRGTFIRIASVSRRDQRASQMFPVHLNSTFIPFFVIAQL